MPGYLQGNRAARPHRQAVDARLPVRVKASASGTVVDHRRLVAP